VHADLRIEVRERLVEQQESGFSTSARASAHSLLLPPESCRDSGPRGRQVHLGSPAQPPLDLGGGELRRAQAIRHVAAHVMWGHSA